MFYRQTLVWLCCTSNFDFYPVFGREAAICEKRLVWQLFRRIAQVHITRCQRLIVLNRNRLQQLPLCVARVNA